MLLIRRVVLAALLAAAYAFYRGCARITDLAGLGTLAFAAAAHLGLAVGVLHNPVEELLGFFYVGAGASHGFLGGGTHDAVYRNQAGGLRPGGQRVGRFGGHAFFGPVLGAVLGLDAVGQLHEGLGRAGRELGVQHARAVMAVRRHRGGAIAGVRRLQRLLPAGVDTGHRQPNARGALGCGDFYPRGDFKSAPCAGLGRELALRVGLGKAEGRKRGQGRSGACGLQKAAARAVGRVREHGGHKENSE